MIYANDCCVLLSDAIVTGGDRGEHHPRCRFLTKFSIEPGSIGCRSGRRRMLRRLPGSRYPLPRLSTLSKPSLCCQNMIFGIFGRCRMPMAASLKLPVALCGWCCRRRVSMTPACAMILPASGCCTWLTANGMIAGCCFPTISTPARANGRGRHATMLRPARLRHILPPPGDVEIPHKTLNRDSSKPPAILACLA